MKLTARLRPPRADALLALALVALSQVEVWHYGIAGGGAAAAVTQGAAGACTAWRRRFPLLAVAGVMAAAVLCDRLAGDPVSGTQIAAMLVLFYTLGALPDRRRAYAGLGLGLGFGIPMTEDGQINTYLAAVLTSFVTPWLVGGLRLRQLRAQALEAEREEAARRAVTEERERLARELHDVVSHNIGMIVVQAEAGDLLLDREPDRARQSLRSIEEAGRTALVEMRRLLGLLRDGGEPALAPQPTLARVDELVDRVRRTGVDVRVSVEGEPVALEPAVDLTAYRVVQEALTNVLKHAGPCTAHVAVRYGAATVEVEVADSGRGAHDGAGGFGLTGLRERVALVGGMLDAGAGAAGGYVVRARLPLVAA